MSYSRLDVNGEFVWRNHFLDGQFSVAIVANDTLTHIFCWAQERMKLSKRGNAASLLSMASFSSAPCRLAPCSVFSVCLWVCSVRPRVPFVCVCVYVSFEFIFELFFPLRNDFDQIVEGIQRKNMASSLWMKRRCYEVCLTVATCWDGVHCCIVHLYGWHINISLTTTTTTVDYHQVFHKRYGIDSTIIGRKNCWNNRKGWSFPSFLCQFTCAALTASLSLDVRDCCHKLPFLYLLFVSCQTSALVEWLVLFY